MNEQLLSLGPSGLLALALAMFALLQRHFMLEARRHARQGAPLRRR